MFHVGDRVKVNRPGHGTHNWLGIISSIVEADACPYKVVLDNAVTDGLAWFLSLQTGREDCSFSFPADDLIKEYDCPDDSGSN